MADGPSTPEEHPKKRSLFSMLFKRAQPHVPSSELSPPSESTTTTSKPDKPEGQGLMIDLEKKNQELGEYLLSEFGEGETRFVVVNHPLDIREDQYPRGKYYNPNQQNKDYLIVTRDGPLILRVKHGDWVHDPQFPQHETVLQRDDRSGIAGDLVRSLIARGNSHLRRPWWTSEENAGSGYTHQTGNVNPFQYERYTFTFAQDLSLSFYADPKRLEGGAFFDKPTPAIQEFAKRVTSTTRLESKAGQILNDASTHGTVFLVTKPKQEEIDLIIEQGVNRAGKQQASDLNPSS